MRDGFFERWRRSARFRLGIDYLLRPPLPAAALEERVRWLVELAAFVRTPPRVRERRADGAALLVPQAKDVSSAQSTPEMPDMMAAIAARAHQPEDSREAHELTPAARVLKPDAVDRPRARIHVVENAAAEGAVGRFRLILTLLEQGPERRVAVAATLGSLLEQLDAIDLLSSAGLAGDLGLGAELLERLFARILPRHRDAGDFGDVLHQLFPDADAAAWLRLLTVDDMLRVRAVLGPVEPSFGVDLREALALLASKIKVIAASEELRLRLRSRRPSGTGFHALEMAAGKIPATGVPPEILAEIEAGIMRAAGEIVALKASLRATGSTLALTYQVHRLDVLLARTRTLVDYLGAAPRDASALPRLLGILANETVGWHEVGPLLSEVGGVVAHRVVDANADVGDHYIARNRSELGNILRGALGGGLVTVLTVYGKVAIEHGHLPPLLKGAFAAMLYAGSFLLIQALGFTLATKQPAMTAAALARTLDGEPGPGRIVAFAKELIHLVRTQIATVAGNLTGVVVGVVCAHFLLTRALGVTFLDANGARSMFLSHSLLGGTPMFAALTGCFLWASSLATGWTANLLRLRQVPVGLTRNRRLLFLLGERGAARVGRLVDPGVPAAAGNMTLGVLLGFVPKVVATFGIPLEARHVTLSSGAIALASLSGGLQGLELHDIVFVALGLVAIGLLNLGVSFGLAIGVALRARDVVRAQRKSIWRAIAAQAKAHPRQLFLPEWKPPSEATDAVSPQ